MATCGLSLSRTKVLQALAGRGALHQAQAELAASLGQAPRSVTQIVEGLERLAMVARTSDPEDRRRKTVSLMDTGRTAPTAVEQAGTHALRQCFGLLEPHQLATRSRAARAPGHRPHRRQGQLTRGAEGAAPRGITGTGPRRLARGRHPSR
ncbi:MarR family winged helix-turn-helix transcriptional regulator [Streptomyces sp. NPDC050535]|uniref:MarR family winged helix-turn-helix transcriptional regulator n=1 Tax=Streptomyces sp. NPDC050535 TaxID=3365626 RepID=UPI0037A39B61